jgi:nuclear transport factor 2 (NTF2) superfamily protein
MFRFVAWLIWNLHSFHSDDEHIAKFVCCLQGLFAPDGRMAERHASINDAPVSESELRVANLPAVSRL